jgi:hypothetical protein
MALYMLHYDVITTGFPVVLLPKQAQASERTVTYEDHDVVEHH